MLRVRVAPSADRQIHLERVRYYLFYRVEGEVLEVLAFWHSSRGSAPEGMER